MKKRFFSYFAVIGVCLSCLNFNAFANPVKRPLVIAVIGENEEDNNKMASLILANDDDLKLHKGIIANPNCSTSQLILALKPLDELAKIKRKQFRFGAYSFSICCWKDWCKICK